MKAVIETTTGKYLVNLDEPLDISVKMRSGTGNPNAFFIDEPRFEPIRFEGFTGSVAEGGSANCENLFINAHGNGTHTECIGHITPERNTISDCLTKYFFITRVITLRPEVTANNDQVIMSASVTDEMLNGIEALVVRSLPNSDDKLSRKWSGTNPPYLDAELCRRMAARGILHLLVDLPSVDREEDGGLMAAHKAFWQYPEAPRMNATISEMIYVRETVTDGIYLLNLVTPSLETDASPSKPLLYKAELLR